ncbi:hypothetical protein CEXT_699891 [Caerostris extrusa]|uniref:Uncharacterized protein n=1 Tax=Caerostris extrusa TaxID=172846 RepID=A0AAV4W4A3_CAEEX|nr:hypothetical protein CEXT_699891 [Caerostris extrusa]
MLPVSDTRVLNGISRLPSMELSPDLYGKASQIMGLLFPNEVGGTPEIGFPGNVARVPISFGLLSRAGEFIRDAIIRSIKKCIECAKDVKLLALRFCHSFVGSQKVGWCIKPFLSTILKVLQKNSTRESRPHQHLNLKLLTKTSLNEYSSTDPISWPMFP